MAEVLRIARVIFVVTGSGWKCPESRVRRSCEIHQTSDLLHSPFFLVRGVLEERRRRTSIPAGRTAEKKKKNKRSEKKSYHCVRESSSGEIPSPASSFRSQSIGRKEEKKNRRGTECPLARAILTKCVDSLLRTRIKDSISAVPINFLARFTLASQERRRQKTIRTLVVI